jgi:NAD(P)H-flavin reductase
MTPVAVRVAGVTRETEDTFTLRIVPGNCEPLPSFQPGQFSMLYCFGVAELPISISGDPENREELHYTVRSVGKATHHLVHREPGEWIGMRGPFGQGWPLEQARGRDVLIIAGGIGLAPLRPVLYQVFRYRGEYGKVILLYGARRPADILFPTELKKWARQPATQVLTTVDYGGVNWRGPVGVVTQLLKRVRLEPGRTVVMTCGPEVMMRVMAAELETRGVAAGDIYLSLERNMKCGCGSCGHCQYGPYIVCRDGPVMPYSRMVDWINKHEV